MEGFLGRGSIKKPRLSRNYQLQHKSLVQDAVDMIMEGARRKVDHGVDGSVSSKPTQYQIVVPEDLEHLSVAIHYAN